MSDARERPPLLSIVVPIYGVEKWLGECLESISAQTFTDWEAILVIDGSRDGSAAIAEEFAARDSRFAVHHFENGGLGRARNRGFDLAAGEYVTFPDSDDYLAPNAYELLISSLTASGSDIATGVAEDFWEDGRREIYWAQRARIFETGSTALALTAEPELVLDHVAWNKVFRSSLLRNNDIRYPVDTLCEDVVHSLRSVIAARSVDVLPDVIYFHRRRSDAITAELLGTRIVNDWITQSTEAVARVIEFDDEPTSIEFFSRLMTSEIWTRVRGFNRIADDAAFARFEAFVALVLESAPVAAVNGLSQLKRATERFVAGGELGRRWRTAGFNLNPFDDRVGSPVHFLQVAIRAVARLTTEPEHERELRRLLLRDTIAEPLLELAQGLSDDQLTTIVDELAALWPDGVPPERFASPSATQLLEAAHQRDLDAVRFISATGFSVFEPALLDIRPHGEDVLLSGEIALDVPIDDSSEILIVLTADGPTRRVRSVPVTHWIPRGESGGARQWRAVFPLVDDLAGSDWVATMRIVRTGLVARNAAVVFVDADGDPRGESRSVGEWRFDVRPGATLTMAVTPLEHQPEARASFDPDTTPVPLNTLGTLPARIVVFPYWTDNPYLEMLYLSVRSRGVLVERSYELDELIEKLGTTDSGDVFHLHWTSPIAQQAESAEDAAGRVARFEAAVLEAQGRGVRVIWTVHNRLPHHIAYRAAELELTAFLAAKSDYVHVMSDQTVDAVADIYDLSAANLLTVEHSSYLGVYGAPPTRADARSEFGIADDETAVLFFGRILPYKGIGSLLEAAEIAGRTRDKLVLLIAGSGDADYLASLEAMLPTNVRVISQFENVIDAEVGRWFVAADLAALPYEDILNSGSVHLAATFGLPSLLPSADHLVKQFADEPWVQFYDRADAVASIADALVAFGDEDRDLSRSAYAAASAYTPFDMANKYAETLAQVGITDARG